MTSVQLRASTTKILNPIVLARAGVPQSESNMASNSTFVGPVLTYEDFYIHIVTYSDPTRTTIYFDELAGSILDQV